MGKGLKIVLIIIGIFITIQFVIPFIWGLIAMPTTVSAINKAKENQFKNISSVIERWFDNQYALSAFGQSNELFNELCGELGEKCKSETKLNDNIIREITEYSDGIDSNQSTIYIVGNGRICVKLVAMNNGDFNGLEDAYSSGCPSGN